MISTTMTSLLQSVPVYKALSEFLRADIMPLCIVKPSHTLLAHCNSTNIDDFQLNWAHELKTSLWNSWNHVPNSENTHLHMYVKRKTIHERSVDSPDLPAPSLPRRASLMSFIAVDCDPCLWCFSASDSPQALLLTLLCGGTLSPFPLYLSLSFCYSHRRYSPLSPLPLHRVQSRHKVIAPPQTGFPLKVKVVQMSGELCHSEIKLLLWSKFHCHLCFGLDFIRLTLFGIIRVLLLFMGQKCAFQ